MALSGHSDNTRVCPLLDQSGHFWIWREMVLLHAIICFRHSVVDQ
jgi:hypothetical protein